MSARRIRRRFAAPFVLVLAVPACSGGAKAPEPQQPTSDLGETWHVSSSGGSCMAMAPMPSCPEGASCNPPPPFGITCPEGLADGASVQVTELAEGSCALVPDGCTTRACVGAATPCPDPR